MADVIELSAHRAVPQQLAVTLLEFIVARLRPQTGQMAADRAHVGCDGHAVVIQNDDHGLAGGSGIIQPLKAETAAQRTVTDQGDHVVVFMAHGACFRHAQRQDDCFKRLTAGQKRLIQAVRVAHADRTHLPRAHHQRRQLHAAA